MTKAFSRWLPCATLFAWSFILLFFYFSARINTLLHPTFRPFALIAGSVMLLLAGCFLFIPATAECCADEGCGHALGRGIGGRLLTFLILLVPMCAAAAFTPGGYGASTVLNRGVINDASALGGSGAGSAGLAKAAAAANSANAANTSSATEPALPTKDGSTPPPQAQAQQPEPTDYLHKSKDGNIVLQVIDLLYAAQDSSLRGDFENKRVEFIGQYMPDTVNNVNGRRFKVVRMLMVCCAADARPVAAVVETERPSNVPEMSWVKVVGEATFPIEGGRNLAVVKAASVTVTDPPEETMLY
jgi:uncharacterized repeat protein (TIGR03943 family)